MSTNAPSTTGAKFNIPTTTRLGHVHLTAKSLDREIQFYTQVLGLKLHWREDEEAALGTASEILLRLTESRSARRFEGTTGLYHFALMYPSRKELARATARLFALRYPNAPTDHGVSKSIYLDDPEGNTIELYILTLDDARLAFENGRGVAYYADGRVGTGRDPLDLEALFSEINKEDRLDLPLPEGTRLGHVNLYVSSNEDTITFYANVLGFQEGTYFPAARFGDLGLEERQPHVVAFNTWKGTGIPPAPAGSLGMRYFTIVLPNTEELQHLVENVRLSGTAIEEKPEGILLRDPSQLNVILTDHMLDVQ